MSLAPTSALSRLQVPSRTWAQAEITVLPRPGSIGEEGGPTPLS